MAIQQYRVVEQAKSCHIFTLAAPVRGKHERLRRL